MQAPTASVDSCGLKGPDNYDVTMTIVVQIS